jgi:hypothetical protein
MAQKKTVVTLVCAFLLQAVAYIIIGRTFASDAIAIVKGLLIDLFEAPETIVRSRYISLDSLAWSIMPWLLGGFLGGILSRGPRKGATGSILAVMIALVLFVVVLLLVDSIGVGALLNAYGYTMVIGFIVAVLLAAVGGALGGTLTQS